MRQGTRRNSDRLVLPIKPTDQATKIISTGQVGFPQFFGTLSEIEPDCVAIATSFENLSCNCTGDDLADIGRQFAVALLEIRSLGILGQNAIEELFPPRVAIRRMQACFARK